MLCIQADNLCFCNKQEKPANGWLDLGSAPFYAVNHKDTLEPVGLKAGGESKYNLSNFQTS